MDWPQFYVVVGLVQMQEEVEQPCDLNYWIDKQIEGRAKKVIQDLVSMRHNMSELYQQSAEQWDHMYADRQIAKQQIRELKRTISEQRECIVILICFSIVIACGLWLIV
jgi:preprotein translocase subunit SecA